jgi:hypothetical protein
MSCTLRTDRKYWAHNDEEQIMASGGGQIIGVDQVKPVTLSSALEDFVPVLQRVAAVITRLSGISDIVRGPRPRDVAPFADLSPPPNGGLIDRARDYRERLAVMMTHIEEAIGDIERAL